MCHFLPVSKRNHTDAATSAAGAERATNEVSRAARNRINRQELQASAKRLHGFFRFLSLRELPLTRESSSFSGTRRNKAKRWSAISKHLHLHQIWSEVTRGNVCSVPLCCATAALTEDTARIVFTSCDMGLGQCRICFSLAWCNFYGLLRPLTTLTFPAHHNHTSS